MNMNPMRTVEIIYNFFELVRKVCKNQTPA